MKKKHEKNLDTIVATMIDALEVPTSEVVDGKKRTILKGEWVTIREEGSRYGCDRAFLVNGEDMDHSVLVQLTHVDL